MKQIKKAIIPAAGLGTRFLPATKAMPKEMLPILDKPTIQYIVEEAARAGIEDIIIVTGKHKRAIEDHFDNQKELEMVLEEKGKTDLLEKVHYSTDLANIFYVRQKEQKGLGHAIYTARQFIGNEGEALQHAFSYTFLTTSVFAIALVWILSYLHKTDGDHLRKKR